MNRCDVSGKGINVALCGCAGLKSDSCIFFEQSRQSNKCQFYDCGSCRNLAAIRAAIEAEGMHINCPECGAVRSLLCDCWKVEK